MRLTFHSRFTFMFGASLLLMVACGEDGGSGLSSGDLSPDVGEEISDLPSPTKAEEEADVEETVLFEAEGEEPILPEEEVEELTDPPIIVGGGGDPALFSLPPPLTATVTFSSELVIEGVPMPESSFSIGSLRELHIYTRWENLDGDHEELRKIYSPDGNLYYQKLLGFSTTSLSQKPFFSHKALPRALMVQSTGITADGEAVVWNYLPIGGSWISEHQMTGTWRVEIFLDDSPTPQARAFFTLTD